MTDRPIPSVGVALTAFKRLHLLPKQLEAIAAQTVKPARIVLWANADFMLDSSVQVPDDVEVWSFGYNAGVWARMVNSQFLGTDYVAVFDDDTIPGPRWLENCLRVQQEIGPSLVGAAGVSFAGGRREQRIYSGWSNPLPAIIRVDIVGHAWFFPSSLLSGWDASLPAKWPTCGEDYYLAYQAQKRGWPVVTAPHPHTNKDWWGSLDGMQGTDDVALYRQPGEEEKKAAFHKLMVDGGWQPNAAKVTGDGDVELQLTYVDR